MGTSATGDLTRVLSVLRESYALTNDELAAILSRVVTEACQSAFNPPYPIRCDVDVTGARVRLLVPQPTGEPDEQGNPRLEWTESPLPSQWRTVVQQTITRMQHNRQPELEMMRALKALAAKYELPFEAVVEAVEEALTEAYRRECSPSGTVIVRIDPVSSQQRLYAVKTAVRRVRDEQHEISLVAARQIEPDVQERGDVLIEESLPESWGRVAALAFRHLVQQKMHSAKQEYAFERFSEQEDELVSGFITRIDPATGSVFIDIGGSEAEMVREEQVPHEVYTPGQHIRAYLLRVKRDHLRGNVVTHMRLSRTTRSLLRRLLEIEVPEIHDGAVEIKSIAREPGSRSKVAVWARQEGLDPVGACVGVRSVRIQNLVKELNGEKVDIILWDPDPEVYVAHALSPASVLTTRILEHEKKVVVEVPADQLSLAIGKEGQNARLASRLTHWNIDIHPATRSVQPNGVDEDEVDDGLHRKEEAGALAP
ncbi:MAG: transcription termination factor NusA [Chloroflexi bacterium]|nr:transcription termination factor NusA [Chloroflexota bacterium]